MARGTVAVMRRPAWAAAVLVLGLTLGTLIAVALRAESGRGFSPADWAAIRFTVIQALVSATFSVALAIPVARALARRAFWGREALIVLLGAPFLLPVIVAVLGLLAVFGRGGVLNDALGAFGVPPVSIYGFWGVILAHVFFNLPLATRLILQGWLSIPAERFRLAAQLNASVFRLLEWPMLARTVPGVALVIFLICLTSFAVALTLGGGPRATTIELAIYQAIRFDFDLGRAALLACVQFGTCAAAAAIAWRLTPVDGFGAGLDRIVQRWDMPRISGDGAWLSLVTLFLLLPLVMVVLRGVPGVFDLPPDIWAATWRSLWVAVCSAGLCTTMALSLCLRGGAFTSFIAVLPLAASALVMGTGLFLIVFPFISPAKVALPITVLVNAVLALPFAVRGLAPSVAQAQADFGRLAATLRLSGWPLLRIVILPRVRAPLGFATGLAAALSMGDLGVIALFATDAQETLPLAMYRLMGAYRMTQAAGAGLLLLGCSLLLFWTFDRWGRHHATS